MASISALAFAAGMLPVSSAFAASSTPQPVSDLVDWMNQKADEDLHTPLDARTVAGDFTVDNPHYVYPAPNQTSFDLRDVDGKNYVSPVKDQNPFGTCWAFATAAAAETSAACQLGIDYNTATEEEAAALDFSERHLAWFVSHPLPADSSDSAQAGEGLVSYTAEKVASDENSSMSDLNYAFFSTGGMFFDCIAPFSSMQAPVPEALAPYHNDAGEIYGTLLLYKFDTKPEEVLEPTFDALEAAAENAWCRYTSYEEYFDILDELDLIIYPEDPDELPDLKMVGFEDLDWWDGPGLYYAGETPIAVSTDGVWGVDESLRFAGSLTVDQFNLLPSPAIKDENGAYKFSENGLNAIKHELVNGRAVAVAYLSDQSRPGDEPVTGSYMTFLDNEGNPASDYLDAAYWCHYTYDKTYDPGNPDSINRTPISNHAVAIVGYDDSIPKEWFYDPNGTLAGDGAFIVKNSWGEGWGNDSTGYFYLSYYDQSICFPASISFDTDEDTADSFQQIHAMMPTDNYDEAAMDQECEMANVYTAEKDIMLRAVSYIPLTCGEFVSYDVYLLNEDYKTPTDGTLAAHREVNYAFGGFQRAELDEPVRINAGQTYAVVVKSKREDGRYGITLNCEMTKEGHEYREEAYNKKAEELLRNPDLTEYEIEEIEDGFVNVAHGNYGIAVVNKGESLLGIDGEWTDLTDILEMKDKTEFARMTTYDNFLINAYGVYADEDEETTTTTTTTVSETTTTTTATTAVSSETVGYSEEQLCDMAIEDYNSRNGVKPAKAEASETEDGSLSITLTDDSGNVLDTYTIDSDTTTGTNSAGDEVDLPQTGSSELTLAAVMTASVFTLLSGIFLVIRSFRRKKDIL